MQQQARHGLPHFAPKQLGEGLDFRRLALDFRKQAMIRAEGRPLGQARVGPGSGEPPHQRVTPVQTN